jgi:hypothetical protein
MFNPAEELNKLPLASLLADLLKQVNKPSLLGARGIRLSHEEIEAIAAKVEAHESQDNKLLWEALLDIVQESLTELKTRFGFSYAESLQTQDMNAIGGWETTAEFLEIANHKSNAELRISLGASLLAFLGDKRAAEHLFTVIVADAGLNDVDALIAKRALSHYAKVEMNSSDWEAKVKAALL